MIHGSPTTHGGSAGTRSWTMAELSGLAVCTSRGRDSCAVCSHVNGSDTLPHHGSQHRSTTSFIPLVHSWRDLLASHRDCMMMHAYGVGHNSALGRGPASQGDAIGMALRRCWRCCSGAPAGCWRAREAEQADGLARVTSEGRGHGRADTAGAEQRRERQFPPPGSLVAVSETTYSSQPRVRAPKARGSGRWS
jgi:hypothetical protein